MQNLKEFRGVSSPFWARMILSFVNKKTKVITTIHDVSMHLGEKNSLIDRFNDYIIRHSHKIVTLSERFIPLISEKYVFNTKQICWIRHGNYNYYRPVNFQNKNSITKRILFFGRIHEYKGISVLLDAMAISNECVKRHRKRSRFKVQTADKLSKAVSTW